MAFNHETGQREQKTVTQTFKRQVDHLRILEVKGPHNYFVAANGYRGPPVLAHNTCEITVTHFTDKKGYDAINSQKEQLFRASNPKGKTGNLKGVYLTNKSIDEIKLKNNGFKKLGLTRAKSEYFFTFKVDKSLLKRAPW